ncbi:TetR family transcriptional regulator [Myxosarcina sp. GI1]|uniref:TetR family transcriptional regulator n=1 Tax=Myxosarcina sp. GI1 TaxID=1541065 RepID=UPI00055BEA01|nr:TetR family transcriptional regulator [Myxosarcina sp. GI1]
MPSKRKSTKARLIEAALDLFAERGVTETTTKAVAERANVNEVTLFRNFGNKYRLLLAVIEDSAVFAKLVHALVEKANSKETVAEFLQEYAKESLNTLEKAPDLVRSVVGEAGNYPVENRLALGKGFAEANKYVADCLAEAIAASGAESHFSAEQIVSLLNSFLFGYFTIKSTAEGYLLWDNDDEFIESLTALFLQGIIAAKEHPATTLKFEAIEDLPANLVRSLLLQAKKLGKQEYAIVYVLFGAGLTVEEIINLERSHSLVEPQQHLLQINDGAVRRVPLNHWIMGFRYGSPTANPLTRWLKNRKDERAALFINDSEQPLSELELRNIWQLVAADLLTPLGKVPTVEQARQTWCVEMLTKGIGLEDLSILSGMTIKQLRPYAQIAREKAAIEQATNLDRKPSI